LYKELSNVRGLIDDIHHNKREIEDNILNNTLLTNEKIRELDRTLQEKYYDQPMTRVAFEQHRPLALWPDFSGFIEFL
jgi:hypothetical protein